MSSDPKSRLYEQLARVGTALASAGRLQLLEFLAQRERSVDALAAMSALSVANCSKHLQALRQAGLVTARKEGRFVFYTASFARMNALVAYLTENCCSLGATCAPVCNPAAKPARRSRSA